jgi:ribosomal protein S18 acetylase RimI-like enzyme
VEGIPIRNARRGDVPSLLLLWTAMMRENAAIDPRLGVHPRAREHMAAEFARWIRDPKRIVVVAEEAGRLVVGFAAALVSPGNGWQVPARLGRISDIFVVPPRRRNGLGRRLAGRLLDLLYEKGVDTVRLAVAVHSEDARAFWESVGWEILEVVLEKEAPADATADARVPVNGT